MIGGGLFLSALCNFTMTLVDSSTFLMIAWGLNGYAAAMTWTPILRLFSSSIHSELRSKYVVRITSSMALGTFGSYLMSAGMITLFGWQAVFIMAALILCIGAFVTFLGIQRTESWREEHGEVVSESNSSEGVAPRSGGEIGATIGILITSGVLLMAVPSAMNGFLKDGATSWIPTYLSDNFALIPAFSILLTMFLPLVNLGGAYLAGMVFERIKNEMKAAAVFFLVTCCTLVLMVVVGHQSVILSVICLAIISCCMMAASVLLVNMFPLRFANQNRVGTVSGFLNFSTYVGSAICTYSVGAILIGAGWITVFAIWLVVSVVAMLWCLMCCRKY